MKTNVQIQADDLLNELHEQLSAAQGKAAYVVAENKALVRAIEELETRVEELEAKLVNLEETNG